MKQDVLFDGAPLPREVDYRAYIRSSKWQEIRQRALNRAGNRCEKCQAVGRLDVHHLTYDRLGSELLEDLLVVCEACHKVEDSLREGRTATKQYYKGFYTFAEKKWGDDWYRVEDDAIERYDRWLEKKQEDW